MAASIPILYEDERLIAIDKPAGLSVQPGEGAGKTVLDILAEQLGYMPRLIHRLDRGTSGVMFLAKDAASASRYGRMVNEGLLAKEYAAMVFGAPASVSGSIDEDIIQRGVPRKALTRYELAARGMLEGRAVSLLSIAIDTGRMHQIRIHLASIGNPIVFDDRHGDFKANKALKSLGIKHIMLCARKASLGPSAPGGKAVTAEAPWPMRFRIFADAASMDLPA